MTSRDKTNVSSNESTEISQYVKNVLIATSTYGMVSHSEIHLVGPPMHYPEDAGFANIYLLPSFGVWPMEAPSYAPEFGTAHLSARENPPIHDFVTVTFEEPVYPTKILIYEIYNPSAVYRVWARDNYYKWKLMWDVRDHYPQPFECPEQARILEIHPPALKERTNILRIELTTRHLSYMTGLDAIMLVGHLVKPVTGSDVARPMKNPLAVVQTPTREPSPNLLLNDLPEEMIFKIFSTLDLPSLQAVSKVSEKFCRIAADSRLYREVNLRQLWMKVDDGMIHFLTERCYNIRKLDISWCETIFITDIERFLSMHGSTLTHLSMNGVAYVDSVFKMIDRHCQNLQELSMQNTWMFDDFHPLQLRCLRRLDLSYTSIRTDALVMILKLNNGLQHLGINGCILLNTSKIVLALAQFNPELITLRTHSTNAWTGNELTALQNCTNLQELDIGCTLKYMTFRFQSLGVEHWPQLKRLSLAFVPSTTSSNVQEIAQHCRVLEQLELTGCDQVEESDVDTILAQCPRLRLLNLTYCSRITLEWIEAARIRYPKVCVTNQSGNHILN